VLISLTDEGLAVVDRAVETHLANEERLLSGLPAAKREQLSALLCELLLGLDDPVAADALDDG
jgi:DNA-binding MarR family transcriptional regulator